jgi:peptidyl-prolyl cis-trans isomerase D
MLKSMRSSAKSAPMKIFLVMLAIGFAMWGIDDVFRNVGSNDAAIKAGDYEISALEAAQEFDRTRRAYLPGANNAEAIGQGILGDVLNGLARRAVFAAEAERLGLTVTRDMEKQYIAGEPAFQDQNGKFNLLRFQDALSRAGLTEEAYVEYIRQDLSSGQILSSMMPGLSYSDSLSNRIGQWRLERRVIDYVTIKVDVNGAATPSNAELDAWYADNKDIYRSPDLRAVTALVLSPDALLSEVTVEDAEIRTTYDNQIDLYQDPERRTLRQMIFADPAAAQEAVNAINGGESFNAIADKSLGLTEDDTMLGDLTRDDLTEELAEPAFNAGLGELIGPIATPLGSHLILVEEITPQKVVSFDDVSDAILDNLKREKAIDLVYQRVGSLEEGLASGATFEETAQSTGAELVQINGLDRSGNNIDGQPIDGIAGDTKFRQSVWTAPVGDVGLVEETNADTFFVLRVDREDLSAERPLADVQDRVLVDMRRETAMTTARNQAESIVSSQDLAKSAKAAGLLVETSPAMRRDGVSFDHKAARLVATKAFGLEINTLDYIETGDDVIVLTVTDIQAADADALAEETERLKATLSSNLATSIEGVIANGLVDIHSLSINAGAVQTLLVGQPN